MRWCAREQIIPTILIPHPAVVRRFVEAYREESRTAGRELKLGERIGVLHGVYMAEDKERARQLARRGMAGVAFPKVFHHFGFSEAWREPADEQRYPSGKVMLPAEEVTVERLERVKFAYTGNGDDIRREMDAMVENVNPEWFVWQGDQGFLPKEEVKQQIVRFGKEVLPRYR